MLLLRLHAELEATYKACYTLLYICWHMLYKVVMALSKACCYIVPMLCHCWLYS